MRRETLQWLLALLLSILLPNGAQPQTPYPFAAPTTPSTQRSAMQDVRTHVNYFRNTTHTASNFTTGAYEMVWARFQVVRMSFNTFKTTLRPEQVNAGANDLAELEAGLDIIQEAFAGYQEEVAAGRSSSVALRSLCRVLDQAAGIWLQEFNHDCTRLRVGW